MPSSENVEVPEVRKYDLKVQNMSGKTVTGLDPEGKKVTMPLPTGKTMADFVDDLSDRIRSGRPTIAIVAQCVGKEAIVGLRGCAGSSDDENTPEFNESDSDASSDCESS
jgi:hypothetical protein